MLLLVFKWRCKIKNVMSATIKTIQIYGYDI